MYPRSISSLSSCISFIDNCSSKLDQISLFNQIEIVSVLRIGRKKKKTYRLTTWISWSMHFVWYPWSLMTSLSTTCPRLASHCHFRLSGSLTWLSREEHVTFSFLYSCSSPSISCLVPSDNKLTRIRRDTVNDIFTIWTSLFARTWWVIDLITSDRRREFHKTIVLENDSLDPTQKFVFWGTVVVTRMSTIFLRLLNSFLNDITILIADDETSRHCSSIYDHVLIPSYNVAQHVFVRRILKIRKWVILDDEDPQLMTVRSEKITNSIRVDASVRSIREYTLKTTIAQNFMTLNSSYEKTSDLDINYASLVWFIIFIITVTRSTMIKFKTFFVKNTLRSLRQSQYSRDNIL